MLVRLLVAFMKLYFSEQISFFLSGKMGPIVKSDMVGRPFIKPPFMLHNFMLLFTINKETSIYVGMTEKEGERMDERRTERDTTIHETVRKTERKR